MRTNFLALLVILIVGNSSAQEYPNRKAGVESQEEDGTSSLRSKNSFGILAGLGITNALHFGGRHHYSNNQSTELSFGTAPFLELTGKKASVLSLGYNYYFVPARVTTHYLSLLFTFFTLRSTVDEPLGNIYFLSPTFGLDWSLESRLTFYIRGGPALRIDSPGGSSFLLNFDIGIGLIF